MKKILIILCILVLSFAQHSGASTASQGLAWDAPVAYSNENLYCTYTGQTGCTSLDIASYTVFWGPTNPPTNQIVIPITSSNALSHMTYTVTGLPVNTLEYYYVIDTDIYGDASGPSNQISALTPKPGTPMAPANVAASIASVI